jgi:hypothetical protein
VIGLLGDPPACDGDASSESSLADIKGRKTLKRPGPDLRVSPIGPRDQRQTRTAENHTEDPPFRGGEERRLGDSTRTTGARPVSLRASSVDGAQHAPRPSEARAGVRRNRRSEPDITRKGRYRGRNHYTLSSYKAS